MRYCWLLFNCGEGRGHDDRFIWKMKLSATHRHRGTCALHEYVHYWNIHPYTYRNSTCIHTLKLIKLDYSSPNEHLSTIFYRYSFRNNTNISANFQVIQSHIFREHALQKKSLLALYNRDISNRNTKMRCCLTLFSVNCSSANWSKKVIGEIQLNLQLL